MPGAPFLKNIPWPRFSFRSHNRSVTVIRFDIDRKTIRLAVRDLVIEGGGLPVPGGNLTAGAAGLGQKLHSLLQTEKIGSSPFYSREETLRWETMYNGYLFIIEGRADLIFRRGKRVRVEEIKTMTLSAADFKKLDVNNYPEYLWQARIYTYLLSLLQPGLQYETALILVNVQSNKIRRTPVEFSTEVCGTYLLNRLKSIFNLLVHRQEELAQRRDWAESIAFPLAEHRPGQQMMMREVARSLEDRTDLLVSAPTGTGKTAGALHPALVFALKQGKRIFYLTGKTTQRRMVEETLRPIHESGIGVRILFLSAAEKMCLNSIHFYNESVCKLASNRLQQSSPSPIDDLFTDPMLTSEKVRDAGARLGVCPYRLSLALAERADVIVCDFNYVFDPGAYLRQFFLGGDYSDFILIIDEAHSLYDRSRQSFSPELKRADIKKVLKLLNGRKAKIRKALARFFRDMDKIFAAYELTGKVEHPEESRYLCDLDRQHWIEMAEEMDYLHLDYLLHTVAHGGLKPNDPISEIYTSIKAFSRVAAIAGSAFRFLYEASGGGVLKIFCCDPSRLLRRRIEGFHSAVAMSATLEPLIFFRDVLGFDPHTTRSLSVPSPFPPENRLFVVVDSISTRYEDRFESYQAIAHLIRDVMRLRRGNYLSFFPSFDYLQAVRIFLPFGEFEVITQRPGMEEAERAEIMHRLESRRSAPQGTLLMAVSGGIFSEGVDFPGDMALGAFVISPSLPPLSSSQELLRQYYDLKCGAGFDHAYIYPGMQKVIQSAGRVIRTYQDKGVILLIGERFGEARYQKLFPEHWYDRSVQDLVAADPVERVRQFWTDIDSLEQKASGAE